MNITIWIITGLLAALFAFAGLMKLTSPKAKLVESGQGWAEDFPDLAVKGIGALELLGALALVIPPALDVATMLVPLAAAGLALLMMGAGITHLRRHEQKNVVVNFVLAGLAVFVAIQRFGAHAF